MTDEVFTASSGVEIKTRDGELVWRGFGAWRSFAPGILQETGLDVALAEYYQWRRDEELGRWRDPECPDRYVSHKSVGPRIGRGDRRWLSIVDEVTGWTSCLAEDYDPAGMESLWGTAKRYFAAHPEPKPWHDAKPGELWALTADGETRNYLMTVDEYFTDEHLSILSPDCFTAGRRIWPEADHDE